MLLAQMALLVVLLVMAGLVVKNHLDYRRVASREFGDDAPLVSIVVPARNEAANIEGCLRGLLAQDYPKVEILVLDDGSTDGTGDLARAVLADHPAVRVLEGERLPDGWAGKCHACAQLAAAARGEWLLFVDADTRHHPQLVRAAMTGAEETRVDFVSTFPRQEIGTMGEALVVPLIYWVLFTLLPIGRVTDDANPALSAACGQFLFVRRSAYEVSGGHTALRDSLHDGLHLARLFKQSGFRIGLLDLSELISCRMYRGWRECWRGFSRNAYQAFDSYPAMATVVLLEIGLFLTPFVGVLWFRESLGAAGMGIAAAQVLVLLGAQLSLSRRFRFPVLSVLLFPVGVMLLIAIQLYSAWRHAMRCPVEWKGRPTVVRPVS